jgi:hypothetical protein
MRHDVIFSLDLRHGQGISSNKELHLCLTEQNSSLTFKSKNTRKEKNPWQLFKIPF